MPRKRGNVWRRPEQVPAEDDYRFWTLVNAEGDVVGGVCLPSPGSTGWEAAAGEHHAYNLRFKDAKHWVEEMLAEVPDATT